MPLTAFFIMRFSLFTAEVMSFMFILMHKFEKRPRFALRVALSALMLAAAVVVVGISTKLWLRVFNYDENDFRVYLISTLPYMVMFALSVTAYGICYRCRFYSLLFCGISGYCARHLMFSIYLLFVVPVCPQYNIYAYIPFTWPVIPVYIAVCAVAGAFICFTFIGRIRRESINEVGREVLLFCLITLFINVAVNSVIELKAGSRNELYITGLVLQSACMMLMLGLFVTMSDRIRLINEKKIINTIREQQEKQYKFAEINAEMLSIRAHDLKHQVAVLRAGGEEAEKLLSELEELTDNYGYVTNRSHNAINTVIAEKWMYCRAHDIKLSRMVDPDALNFMENTDVYALIGNILDNCVEAVMHIEDKNKRVITITVSERGGAVSLSTNNYYEGQLKMSDGLPVTTKPDGDNHGFGMRSIRCIVDKYDGNIQVTTDDNIFILCITFCKK